MFYLQYLEIELQTIPGPCSLQICLLHAPSEAQAYQGSFQLTKHSLQQLIPPLATYSRAPGSPQRSPGRGAQPLISPRQAEREGRKSREREFADSPRHPQRISISARL